MMNYKFTGVIIVLLLIVGFHSCTKPVDGFPNSNEAISFSNLDSTTIKKRAGEVLEVNVVLTTDTIIDSLKIGYIIDTLGFTTNISYVDIREETIVTGFEEVNNRHQYLAKIKLPANAYGIRAFRPYVNNVGDYVRIIFRMEAGSRSYEKQLKVIIEP